MEGTCPNSKHVGVVSCCLFPCVSWCFMAYPPYPIHIPSLSSLEMSRLMMRSFKSFLSLSDGGTLAAKQAETSETRQENTRNASLEAAVAWPNWSDKLLRASASCLWPSIFPSASHCFCHDLHSPRLQTSITVEADPTNMQYRVLKIYENLTFRL